MVTGYKKTGERCAVQVTLKWYSMPRKSKNRSLPNHTCRNVQTKMKKLKRTMWRWANGSSRSAAPGHISGTSQIGSASARPNARWPASPQRAKTRVSSHSVMARIQIGLYARTNSSVQRFDGLDDRRRTRAWYSESEMRVFALTAMLLVACGTEKPRGVEMVAAPPGGDVPTTVKRELDRAQRDGRQLLIYVGATWCEPCQRFHRA